MGRKKKEVKEIEMIQSEIVEAEVYKTKEELEKEKQESILSQNRMDDKCSEKMQLEIELNDLEDHKERLSSVLEQTKLKIKETQENKTVVNESKIIQVLKKEVEDLNNQLESENKRLENLNVRIGRFNEMNDNVEKIIINKTKELKSLPELDETTEDPNYVTERDNRISNLNQEISFAKDDRSNFNNRIKETQEMISTQKTFIEQMGQSISDKKNEISKYERQNFLLNRPCANDKNEEVLESDLIEKQIKDCDVRIISLKSRIEKITIEINAI